MKRGSDASLFTARGLRRREFFPHEVTRLRKQYPDTILKLERRGFSPERIAAGRCYQINVYSPRIEDFPVRLFRDRAINWHAQQFGRDGLIGAAGLFVEAGAAYVTLLQSDLCQQIFRSEELKRECASRLNNRFRYWYKLVLNAILDFAADLALDIVYSPTAAHIIATTPRPVDPGLFTEIYDSVAGLYECTRDAQSEAQYWRIELAANRERIARLEPASSELPAPERVICLYHDVEQDVDTMVSKAECAAALARMLELEHQRGVRATYNVLGTIFREVAPSVLDSDCHTLGFHTYDHQINDSAQLGKVRQVDLQVKGYRPAQSVITPEITWYNLSLYNFEWLMSSARSLGIDEPTLENGIVRIPVHQDDWGLATGEPYDEWTQRLFRTIAAKKFVAVGLHDCYSRYWIEQYDALLARLQDAGEMRSCDELASYVYRANAL
jgi:hypothetical protein